MKKFDIHEWQAKIRLAEQTMSNFGPVRSVEKYNGLPIRDNVMDYASEILNQIEDYKNNVGPGEIPISYIETIAAVEALQTAVDNDEADMDTIAKRAMGEVEVTGMEPDSGNTEKEFKIINPTPIEQSENKAVTNGVEIEYKGQLYTLDFNLGDIIDDHGNEGRDEWWEAEADDGHIFRVDVYTPFPADEVDPDAIYWDTLEVEPPAPIEPMGEQNSLGAAGSGAEFNPGIGMGHFGKRKRKIKEQNLVQEPTTQDDASTDMQSNQDVEKIQNILPSINTPEEWKALIDEFTKLDVTSLSDAQKRAFLLLKIKEL